MTTADSLARFVNEYQIPRSITPDRASDQLRQLRSLAEHMDRPLIELTQQDVLVYLGALLTRGLNPNSVRTYSMMIRSFVTWGHMAGLIETDRANMIKLIGSPRGSSPHATPNPYNLTEVRRFRAVLAAKYPLLPEYGRGSRALPRYQKGTTDCMRRHLWRHARRLQFEAQVALALELGLRSKEIVDLSLAAGHYDNDALPVVTAKQGPGNQKVRSVPWTPHAQQCMIEWTDFRSTVLHPPNDSLWVTLAYTARGVEQLGPLTLDIFHRALNVFGGGWRWHRFRHTAATEWLRAGMPVEKLRVLLGHGSIEQTLAYTEILKVDISDAMASAQAAFNKRMGL